METGLPIGHHYMACDHAPAGGSATWDLADAALDFHDRNCVTCPHRVPVRLPNLTSLLQQRDIDRKRAADDTQAREERVAGQRAARQFARRTLRAKLSPLSAAIVDHLEEIDQGTSKDAEAQLLGAAQLAPETFTATIVEHCFSLLEGREGWFDETGLLLLQKLQADQRRLTCCALRSLGERRSIRVAAAIVEVNSALIDESLIDTALPALIDLANPEHMHFWGGERDRVPVPLIVVYRAQPDAVEAGIGKLLDQRAPYLVSSGARAIQALVTENKAIASHFSRSLLAKLARAHLLIDARETGYSGEDEVIHRLQDALALALESCPEETDALVAQFIASAASEGEVRIYKAYGNVLHNRRDRDDGRSVSITTARVALKRLISAASISDDERVLREIHDTLSFIGSELTPVARGELNGLLGAAMLLGDRIQRFDAGPIENGDFLSRLEHRNRLGVLVNLQSDLVKWAANAASGDDSATEQYIEILGRLPEGQDQLRSVLVRSAHRLMQTPSGLNAALPALYSAMVGTSVRTRSSAAEAIGKLTRRGLEDVPELLYEAFTSLLFDPYVMVHRVAVDTLEHLTLPDWLNERSRAAVAAWIDSYAVSRMDDRFLLQCIQIYLRRFSTDLQKQTNVGKNFVALMERMKSDVVAEKISWLRHDLRAAEGFAELVLRILADPDVTHYRQDEILNALNELPVSTIQQHKAQLEAIATTPAIDRSLSDALVETLTGAGAWEEAARINETIYSRIPDTVERRAQKLRSNLNRIATKYEEAIASGKVAILPELAQEWRQTEAQIEEHRTNHAERRSPFTDLPGAH
ncbi:hypothetical protein [Paraburkholderia elongata]|uniref:Uncharacterized protein n=1 Tax=Paraburkholderia elongata TaxID=2675747 RepID=A0A972NT34_9BURK|nr:hypothetical protein [Paraburkholderia elongata]NPT57110.1 hypothetical protein [Paraburkholderia elongata]